MLSLTTLADAVAPLAPSPAAITAVGMPAAVPVPRTGTRTAPFGTAFYAPQRRTRTPWTATSCTTSSKHVQMARIAPTGGGASGSHPARDPV